MSKTTTSILRLLSVIALGFFSGCGGGGGSEIDGVPIGGTVTLDGQPLGNVSLIFNTTAESGGRNATAIVDASGKFDSVTTIEPGDGILKGTYIVTLNEISSGELDVTDEGSYSETPDAGSLPFPSKFLNTAESDFKVEITDADPNMSISLLK